MKHCNEKKESLDENDYAEIFNIQFRQTVATAATVSHHSSRFSLDIT